MTDGMWCALHIHRYDDQDGLLVDGVAPLLHDLSVRGLVTGFFFLRYWRGGPHVRLRLRTAGENTGEVPAEATTRLAAFLRSSASPGSGLDPAEFIRAQQHLAVMEGERPMPLEAPDTIRAAHYEPEYDKYGGPHGVAIAERLFQCSTRTVLGVLRERPAARLGTGFSMLVGALRAAGLTPAQMAGFCAHYCRLWTPYVFPQFVRNWPTLLTRQRAGLAAHTAGLLTTDTGSPWATAVHRALADVAADPAVLPAVRIAGPDAPAIARRRALLASYVHTHNNRLGRIPEQEAFLGYLGHHVISTVAGTPAVDGLDGGPAADPVRLPAERSHP